MAKNKNYEEWLLADLHAEAGKREIEGRATMNKEDLVKALKADDAKPPLPPDRGESDPKTVKLVRPKEPDGSLSDVIPVAPTAAAGKLPRLLDDNERAPAGCTRFAIFCNDYPTTPTMPKRYVLVKAGPGAQAEAEAYYKQTTRLDRKEAKDGVTYGLSCRELPD